MTAPAFLPAEPLSDEHEFSILLDEAGAAAVAAGDYEDAGYLFDAADWWREPSEATFDGTDPAADSSDGKGGPLMGTYIHRAVIAEMPPYVPGGLWADRRHEVEAKLAAFRESLPGDDWRALIVGPVQSVINQFEWVIFLPDGSKEWWDTSDEGDGYREQFLAIFPDALIATWGDEESTLRESRR